MMIRGQVGVSEAPVERTAAEDEKLKLILEIGAAERNRSFIAGAASPTVMKLWSCPTRWQTFCLWQLMSLARSGVEMIDNAGPGEN
jgi:hypothetical protein